MLTDYFISYSAADRDRAENLVNALEADGARCFIDFRDIEPDSQRYREDLARGIKRCDRVLVLLSSSSQASNEVSLEVQFAHDHGRRLTAVWLENPGQYTNDTLALLLSCSQRVEWRGQDSEQVARTINSTTTIASLQRQLAEYTSVTEALHLDLRRVFLRIDEGDLHTAMDEVEKASRVMLTELWKRYELGTPAPTALRDLLSGCRDRIQHESMLLGFSVIVQAVEDALRKPATIDRLARSVESLVSALSIMRTQRWGQAQLDPAIRAQATFLAGLLIESGWLQGSELVPRPDVAYMLFERAKGHGRQYLELLLGSDQRTIDSLAEESSGRILPASEAPLKTRFIVLPEGTLADSRRTGVMTPSQFVRKFTAVQPLEPGLGERESSASPEHEEIVRHLGAGRRNVLLYGAPGTGKSTILRSLAERGWPGAPEIRFYVDYAAVDLSGAATALDEQLGARFPPAVRGHARQIVSYLVRNGRAALLLDSVECATGAGNSLGMASTFARLCAFLSEDSQVVLAGRDAVLRDSPSVREFFLREPAMSDQLSRALHTSGVDSSRLPRFAMVRARHAVRRATTARTPLDRVLDALAGDIWHPEGQVAARALAHALSCADLSELVVESTPLSREQLECLAVGANPRDMLLPALDMNAVPNDAWCTRRSLRELRAAIDYAHAALTGADQSRWHGVSVGETARRIVRLLSISLGDRQLTPDVLRLSLVGPPGQVLAVVHGGPVRLGAHNVTAREYREFLRALPSIDSGALSPDLPDEGHLYPMYERVPHGYFRDPEFNERPAIGVSWWGADTYARWAGGRLPTSLEWEVTGRSWDGRVFPWGDTPRPDFINCADTSAGRPIVDYASWREAVRRDAVAPRNSRSSAGSQARNMGELGQEDLVGNVWEWTATHVHTGAAVIAGGSYDNPVRACVLSSRSVAPPSTRSNALGFRIVEGTP